MNKHDIGTDVGTITSIGNKCFWFTINKQRTPCPAVRLPIVDFAEGQTWVPTQELPQSSGCVVVLDSQNEPVGWTILSKCGGCRAHLRKAAEATMGQCERCQGLTTDEEADEQ